MNIELDRQHYTKLLILAGLWKDGSSTEMVRRLSRTAGSSSGRGSRKT